MKTVRKILPIFIIWRLLLFLPLFFLPFLPQPDDTRYIGISPWANFDGIHYLSIAVHGYTTEARFFPLYPFLIKGIMFLFQLPFNTYVGYLIGFVMSNIFFLLGLVILYKLLRIEYSDKISFQSIMFLLLFPTAFFFGSIYAESLFLFLVTLSLYLARKQKWFLAILLAIFLPMTRSVGIAIIPALFVEWFLEQKEKNKPRITSVRGKPSLAILYSLILIPISLIGYAFYNYTKWGNWFYFIQAQAELSNGRAAGIVLIPQTLFRYTKILLTVPVNQYIWYIAFFELAVFIFSAILLYIAYVKKVRLSYLAFAILAFLIPTLTGTFTGLPRYVIVLFPMFIALALIKSRQIKILYTVVSVILSFILLLLFAKGYYIA